MMSPDYTPLLTTIGLPQVIGWIVMLLIWPVENAEIHAAEPEGLIKDYS